VFSILRHSAVSTVRCNEKSVNLFKYFMLGALQLVSFKSTKLLQELKSSLRAEEVVQYETIKERLHVLALLQP